MMRSGVTPRPILLGLLTSVTLLLPGACHRAAEDTYTGELGRRIAGTWLGSCYIDAFGPVETPFIRTFYVDGTGLGTSARELGAGDPAAHGLTTTQHIMWEKAGPREIRWRQLHFGHDADGNLDYISRTHGLAQFDADFESCSDTVHVEVFAPGVLLEPLDPNNPDATPSGTAEGTCRARRLHIRIP